MNPRQRKNRSGSIRYLADTYDAFGRKEVTSHLTAREARDAYAQRRAAAKAQREAGGGKTLVDRNVKFEAFAETFLAGAKAKGLRPSTLTGYRNAINNHLVPAFKGRKVRDVGEQLMSKFLTDMLNAETHARGSVANIYTTAVQIMQAAVRPHRLLSTNPLRGLGTILKLGRKTRGGLPKAMRPEQLAAFLAATLEWRRSPPKRVIGRRGTYRAEHVADQAHDVPVFAVMAWAGLRIGEAIHLRPEDVDLDVGVLRVRSADDGEWQPKSECSVRAVDIADNLRVVLEQVLRLRPTGSKWLLYPELGDDTEKERRTVENHIRGVMDEVLKYAGIRHFGPHSLRHSFAMALLESGVSIAYVSQQLGHASIKVTVDVYGSSWPIRAPGAATAAAAASTPVGFLDALAVASMDAFRAGRSTPLDVVLDAPRGRRTNDHGRAMATAAGPDDGALRDTTTRVDAAISGSSNNRGNNSAETRSNA